MRKLYLLLPIILLLVSCGKETSLNEGAFFDPVKTDEELSALVGQNELKTFAENYVFIYSDVKIKQPTGMCWFNGKLHISDNVSMQVAALNPDGTLETAYLPGVNNPQAIATGSDENLYVVYGQMHVADGILVSIGIFDTDYNEVSPAIEAVIPCDPDKTRINSIAAVDDAVYLTLSVASDAESGKIYKFTSDGKVSDIGGNKSFGNLARIPGGFVFVNSDMPAVSQGGNQQSSLKGVSAIYKIAEDAVVDFITLPTHMSYEFTEEELEAWSDAVAEQTGSPPSEEDAGEWRKGIPIFATVGYGGICLAGDKIIVASKELPVLHCFDLDMNYLWTQKVYYEGHNFWDLEQRYRDGDMLFLHFYAYNLFMCEDPATGTLYILQRPLSDTNTFGILKGTPIV
jgi:hypothetical protein